ncbi:hypothetical protein AB0873_28985 [Micromonospora sp. NPDC047707]|uniref:alpha/beta fold hydrolase n=1 Tax=Micromonospora sp. NPDC047707 TaxID=3154498 RepID=UPI003453626D
MVANSFGCHLAVELAVRHPHRVHALILTGPTATPASSGLPALLTRWAMTALREPTDVVPLALRDLRRSGIRHAAAQLREGRRYPLARRLAQVSAPTLVVRGQQDHLAPARWSRHLASIARRGRLVHVPGAHMLPYERPRLVADLVDMADAVTPSGRRGAGTVGHDRRAGS